MLWVKIVRIDGGTALVRLVSTSELYTAHTAALSPVPWGDLPTTGLFAWIDPIYVTRIVEQPAWHPD
jgi:hypothetical protein